MNKDQRIWPYIFKKPKLFLLYVTSLISVAWVMYYSVWVWVAGSGTRFALTPYPGKRLLKSMGVRPGCGLWFFLDLSLLTLFSFSGDDFLKTLPHCQAGAGNTIRLVKYSMVPPFKNHQNPLETRQILCPILFQLKVLNQGSWANVEFGCF